MDYGPRGGEASAEEIRERLRGSQLLALDVDGVLTDGRVVYGGGDEDGFEIQSFDVRDGYGLAKLIQAGIQVVWITGRGCAATRRRAQELGIARLIERAGPKDKALSTLRAEFEIESTACVAMGDDLPDLGLFAEAGLCVAPLDARPEVRARAHWVSAHPGGRGAVRELCDLWLRALGAAPFDELDRDPRSPGA